MYILIKETVNGILYNEITSKFKYKIVNYLKLKGYYWNKKYGRYIDDVKSRLDSGSGIDYFIEKIYELK